ATLMPAIEKCDWETAGSTAHRVKGASRTVGAHQFAQVASEVETEARSGGVTDLTCKSIIEAHTSLIFEIGAQYGNE
ncbi:MAG: Hpt domain-containing protein, partial [Fibrobacterales bacterium]